MGGVCKYEMAQEKSDYDSLYKLVLIGDRAGKTNIITRFIDGTFTIEQNASLNTVLLPTGVDFVTKTIGMSTVDSEQNLIVKLQIWDITINQERYHSLYRHYYRGAHGMIIVFDVTNEGTFDNAINKWVKDGDDYIHADVVKMIVGNKCDLEEYRVVSRERAQLVADDIGAMYREVSAKTGYNVDQIFIDITHEIIKSNNYI